MAHKHKSSRKLRTKLKPLYAAMLPLMVFGVNNSAIAAVISYADAEDKAGVIVLTDNSTQLQVTTGTGTQSGGISGAFDIEKIGAGILNLSGVNSYQGDTNVSAGTLRLSGGSAISNTSGTVNVSTGATLNVATSESINGFAGAGSTTIDAAQTLTVGINGAVGTYSGIISGAGALSSFGNRTLSGANNYSGGTTVGAGILQGTTTSLQGNIINNATVNFDQTSNGIYADAMSGSGSLIKSNTAMVTLSGANIYTGVTTIEGGTLGVTTGGSITTGNTFNIGDTGGSDGTLAISGGGVVSNTTSTIGNAANSDGSVTVDGAGSTWTNTLLFTIGNNGTGSLDISDGGVVSSVGSFLGSFSGSDGSVTVDGAGSSWSLSSLIQIGLHGSGSLDISGGGAVSNTTGSIGASFADGDGSVTVDGAGSTWVNTGKLDVGAVGTGSLDISAGGVVSNTIGIIGKAGDGSVTVDGTGSTWSNSSTLTVGAAATGSLDISGGGMVSNTVGIIGNQDNGSVTVDGAGSSWVNSDTLTIGGLGNGIGSLDISAGGVVSSTTSTIGDVAGSDGSVTVDGAGSTWTNTLIFTIGNNGTGSLDISDGGAVSSVQGFVGVFSGSDGSVTVDGTGSSWSLSSILQIGRMSTGSLDISDGGAVSNTIGIIGKGGDASATVDGTGSTWTNSSTLTVGAAAAGSLDISGGGMVSNTVGIIGNQDNGSVTVAGTGSSWVNSDTLTIGGISGTGSLDISDGGVVNIASTTTLAVNAAAKGTLNIGAGGAAGILNTVSVDGGAGTAILNFNHTDANYFFTNDGLTGGTGVAITGSTAVNHLSTGKTTLTGANTHSGGTTISAGTLQIGNGGTTGSVAGNITNDSALIFNRSDTVNYTDDISGTGSLTKNGAGFLVLTGDNNYTGTTTITDGTLDIGNGGTTGSIAGDIINNATLRFLRANDYTYSGDISGTGNVFQSETGTVTLTGNATHTGGTTLTTGPLQIGNGGTTGSITGDITNNTSLIFNRSDALTYADEISGAGSFTQEGSGSTNLTGVNTYMGVTTINAGTLFVNGSNSASTTTVNTGGTLGGTGTVGSVNINGGTFAPGNSIGTTNVTGNVDFSGSGIYQVEVDDAGNSDLINATGSAILTSGIVQVLPEAGAYNVSTDYTILTAASGLGGTTFSSVTSNLAFLDPTLSYDTNNVFLNLTRNDVDFSAVAGTPNQTAVSTVIGDNAVALQEIANILLTLTTTGTQQALDSLSGVQHTHGQLITKGLSHQFLNLLFNRGSQSSGTPFAFNSLQNFDPMSGQLFVDNSSALPASYSGGAQYGSTTPERGWWLQGFGGFGDIDTTTNASGADYDTQGLAFGVDTEWRDMVIGVAGSYARSDADTFGGSLDIDSFQAATYANWQRDAVYLTGALGFGFHDTDSSRAVIVGLSTSTATADYDTVHVSASVETGKAIPLSIKTTLTPFAGVEYTHSNRDSFTETGAGIANLSVDDEDEDSLRTKLGLRLSHDFTTQKGTRITPVASIAYVREFMDNVSRLDAAFSSVPTSTFQIDGSDLDRDRVHIGLGVTGQINETTTLNVGYNGEIAGSDDHHSFAATVRMVW